MELYKFSGTKAIELNDITTSATINTAVSETIPTLSRSSKTFTILNVEVYVDVKYLLEAPLSFANKDDTDLQKWDRDRELIKSFSNIGLRFSLGNLPIFRSFVTGSSISYDFRLNRNIRLSDSQTLSVALVNTGHGLLQSTDKIVISFPYEATIMGVN